MEQVHDGLRDQCPRSAVLDVDEPDRIRWTVPHITGWTGSGYVVEFQISKQDGATHVDSLGGLRDQGWQFFDGGNEVGRAAARALRAVAKELGTGDVDRALNWFLILFLAVTVPFLLMVLALLYLA